MEKIKKDKKVKSQEILMKDLNNLLNIGRIIKNYNKRIYKIATSSFSNRKDTLYFCNKIESLMIYKIAAYNKFLNTKKFLNQLSSKDKDILLDYGRYNSKQEIADKNELNVRTVFRKIDILSKSYELYNKNNKCNLVAEV